MHKALELGKGRSPKGTQDPVTKRSQKGYWAAILARTHYAANSRKLLLVQGIRQF